MPESQLLKFARVRDDQEFKWRIGAAMTLKAQALENDGNVSAASRLLINWVLDNPLQVPFPMLAQVITNGTVAGNVSIADNVINTSAVPDGDIEYVVGATWDTVANLIFSPQRSRSGGAVINQIA